MKNERNTNAKDTADEMATEITYCGGRYEVHPMTDGGYAVVNGERGMVTAELRSKSEAVAYAVASNAELELSDSLHNEGEYAN